ncbi:MAG: hypothetical protein SGBAC_007072 [Bacillariaceae sp.]
MNSLSYEEREEQEESLHGVAKDISEEANVIENALKELDSHLVRQKAGTAYETAEIMSANYVSHRAFRTMFLRGNRYDTKAAADQMLRFFEMKQQIFGNEKLVKEITIEDLDEDDRASLRTGWTQHCGRDRAGRMIIMQLLGARETKTVQSELRARYFVVMSALQSDQTQLRGVVWICCAIGENKAFQTNPVGFEEIVDVSLRCPAYPAAVHFLTDDIREYFLCNAVVRIMAIKLRTRIRLHLGSYLECQYRLSTYGILKESLSMTANSYKHLHWYQACFTKTTAVADTQATTSKSVVVTQPTPHDVLYTGGNKSNNAGNDHLRNLVAEWSQTYDSETNEVKRRVVNELIEEIHRSGGRFLSQAHGGDSVWATVPSDEVRSKITQMFRNRRRKVRGTRKKR